MFAFRQKRPHQWEYIAMLGLLPADRRSDCGEGAWELMTSQTNFDRPLIAGPTRRCCHDCEDLQASQSLTCQVWLDAGNTQWGLVGLSACQDRLACRAQ
jgi:hypothetical protein